MDLIRNMTRDGSCKYRVWDNAKSAFIEDDKPGDENEFFVIKLKDVNASVALHAYANSAQAFDPEYARQVKELAARAGLNHPACKIPDNSPKVESTSQVDSLELSVARKICSMSLSGFCTNVGGNFNCKSRRGVDPNTAQCVATEAQHMLSGNLDTAKAVIGVVNSFSNANLSSTSDTVESPNVKPGDNIWPGVNPPQEWVDAANQAAEKFLKGVEGRDDELEQAIREGWDEGQKIDFSLTNKTSGELESVRETILERLRDIHRRRPDEYEEVCSIIGVIQGLPLTGSGGPCRHSRAEHPIDFSRPGTCEDCGAKVRPEEQQPPKSEDGTGWSLDRLLHEVIASPGTNRSLEERKSIVSQLVAEIEHNMIVIPRKTVRDRIEYATSQFSDANRWDYEPSPVLRKTLLEWICLGNGVSHHDSR